MYDQPYVGTGAGGLMSSAHGAGPQFGARSSTRLHAPPGGHSSISLGGYGGDEEISPTRRLAASQRQQRQAREQEAVYEDRAAANMQRELAQVQSEIAVLSPRSQAEQRRQQRNGSQDNLGGYNPYGGGGQGGGGGGGGEWAPGVPGGGVGGYGQTQQQQQQQQQQLPPPQQQQQSNSGGGYWQTNGRPQYVPSGNGGGLMSSAPEGKGPQTVSRSSTRLHAPPGGFSSLTFG